MHEAGHTIEDYRQLKDVIEKKIQEGHLDKNIAAWTRDEPPASSWRHGDDAPPRIQGAPPGDAEPQPLRTIYIMHGGATQEGFSIGRNGVSPVGAQEDSPLHNNANTLGKSFTFIPRCTRGTNKASCLPL
ncbi:hypothetical protein ACLOJK_040562 [Asimina triloba]